jgi:hypothetical protein
MTHMDYEGVKFIEHGSIRFQAVHEKIAGFIVGNIFWQQPMPKENAFRICIYNKCRLVSSIKENAIRCLWAYAVYGEQLDP